MILSTTPQCTGLSNLKTSPVCVYDQQLKVLKLTKGFDELQPRGTTFEFTVNSFQNPYNTKTYGGFRIATMDNSGLGKIDESPFLSIFITDFTSLDNPSVARGEDMMNIVGEFSSLVLSFQLNIPIDQGCLFRVYFPAD